jgi:hypothetical protein
VNFRSRPELRLYGFFYLPYLESNPWQLCDNC